MLRISCTNLALSSTFFDATDIVAGEGDAESGNGKTTGIHRGLGTDAAAAAVSVVGSATIHVTDDVAALPVEEDALLLLLLLLLIGEL